MCIFVNCCSNNYESYGRKLWKRWNSLICVFFLTRRLHCHINTTTIVRGIFQVIIFSDMDSWMFYKIMIAGNLLNWNEIVWLQNASMWLKCFLNAIDLCTPIANQFIVAPDATSSLCWEAFWVRNVTVNYPAVTLLTNANGYVAWLKLGGLEKQGAPSYSFQVIWLAMYLTVASCT